MVCLCIASPPRKLPHRPMSLPHTCATTTQSALPDCLTQAHTQLLNTAIPLGPCACAPACARPLELKLNFPRLRARPETTGRRHG